MRSPPRPKFCRYGTFRIGNAIHLDHVVTEDTWNVKWGKLGLATEDMYREDDRLIRDNCFAAELREAFQIAEIEYGRADFSLVDGRPQIYEINTNPTPGISSATSVSDADGDDGICSSPFCSTFECD